jgi:hypothetical protein
MGEIKMNQEVEEKETTVAMGETSKKVNTLNLQVYSAVGKFKSIRRAIRRGHVAYYGIEYPKRPFNNRKNKPLENIKKTIYHGIKTARANT